MLVVYFGLQKDIGEKYMMHNTINNDFWAKNLVCPKCKSKLKIEKTTLCCNNCGEVYDFKNGVPNFISQEDLTPHQKSELEYLSRNLRQIRKNFSYNSNCYKWALKWINSKTVNENSKIVCIGGAYSDDLPHVITPTKFNVDHLAHKFVELLPEIKNAKTNFITATSEDLPFPDNYADIVYSRNSLDHVCNPIKTLCEINRILKPDGKFYLLVYYNSSFIDSGETTSINKEFISLHLKNIFDVNYLEIKPPESEGVKTPPDYSLPNNVKLGFLYAVLSKCNVKRPYRVEELNSLTEFISNFHSAIYFDNKFNLEKAAYHFQKILSYSPFFDTDEYRLLYSRIRYLAIKEPDKLKSYFRTFKINNKNPFWWMVFIRAMFQKPDKAFIDEIRKNIEITFNGKEREFLIRQTSLGNLMFFYFKNKIKIYSVQHPWILPWAIFGGCIKRKISNVFRKSG